MVETLARAVEVGNPSAQALCTHALGAVYFLLGRWEESAEQLGRSVELARSVESVFGEILGEQRLARLETARGDREQAHERLQRALALAEDSPSRTVKAHGVGRVLASLAENRYQAGDLAGATRYVAQGMRRQQVIGDCASCDVLLYPVAVQVYLAHGDLELARQSAHRAADNAGGFGGQSWVATSRYLLALIAAAEDDWAGATEQLERTLEMFQELQTPYEVAVTSQALAQALERSGGNDLERIEQLRAAAAESFASLPAVPTGGLPVPAAS